MPIPRLAELDEREAGLWADMAAKRSEGAREALFNLYLPFARGIARRHFRERGGDIELPDLCQLAYVGLLEAIDRFDASLGTPFMGFASRRIAGSILDGITKTSEVREQISFRNRVRDERANSLAADASRDLSGADALLALIDAAVGLALGFMLEGTAIYRATDAADARSDAYESLVWKQTVQSALNGLSDLPEREAFVIRSHYIEGVGFQEIGQALGLSKGRVSQIHRAALFGLRKAVNRQPPLGR